MKTLLEEGDRIKLLPQQKLLDVLRHRNFCLDDETRQASAKKLGGKEGVVASIEMKWAADYFYFRPDGDGDDVHNYSIPYESVDFEAMKQSQEEV